MPAHDPFGWVGQTIASKLRVDAVVAEGGFAVVYRAEHLGFGERVALKCLKLPAELEGARREAFLRAFMDEGKLLHRLSRSDAGVVQALDIGAAVAPNGAWTPYLALEWLDGRSLEDDLREREGRGLPPRSVADALVLLDSAASALTHAHAEGIAHRDIKPSNLFLAEIAGRRRLKVVDFGIAKVMTDAVTTSQRQALTGAALQPFSPAYGAPEQFDRAYGPTGPWTDVFAFALVFVELVTGQSALGDGDTLQLFVAATNPARRPTPRTLGANVSDPVERVLRRALMVKPGDRYADLGELWAALQEAGRVPLVPSTPRPTARPEAPRPVAYVGTPVTPLRSQLQQRPQSRRTVVLGTAIACVVTAASVFLGLDHLTARGKDGPTASELASEPSSSPTLRSAPLPAMPPATAGATRGASTVPNASPMPASSPAVSFPPAPAAPVIPGETIRASHILVAYQGAADSHETRSREEARARAAEVQALVAGGADFAEIALVYGDDATRANGGNLGTFSRKKFPAAFTTAAFALRPGETSGVVETRYGFHIVRRSE